MTQENNNLESISNQLLNDEKDLYNVDLCFMIDCTSSMNPYIKMAKSKVKEIMAQVRAQYTGSIVRVAIVAYRDISARKRFQMLNFTTKADSAIFFLSYLDPEEGQDIPEDMNGGFQKALYELDWNSITRILYHIADAPCHGKKFHEFEDDYPNGYKFDRPWEEIFRDMKEKNINYVFFNIKGLSKLMFEQFMKIYDSVGECGDLIFNYEILGEIIESSQREEKIAKFEEGVIRPKHKVRDFGIFASKIDKIGYSGSKNSVGSFSSNEKYFFSSKTPNFENVKKNEDSNEKIREYFMNKAVSHLLIQQKVMIYSHKMKSKELK